jgi:hypothetical protein
MVTSAESSDFLTGCSTRGVGPWHDPAYAPSATFIRMMVLNLHLDACDCGGDVRRPVASIFVVLLVPVVKPEWRAYQKEIAVGHVN